MYWYNHRTEILFGYNKIDTVQFLYVDVQCEIFTILHGIGHNTTNRLYICNTYDIIFSTVYIEDTLLSTQYRNKSTDHTQYTVQKQKYRPHSVH